MKLKLNLKNKKSRNEIILISSFTIALMWIFVIGNRIAVRNKIINMDNTIYISITPDRKFFAKAYHLITIVNDELSEKDKLCGIQSVYNAATKHKEDAYLYLAIAKEESSFRPKIIGEHGEIGWYQVKIKSVLKYFPFPKKELRKILKFISPNTIAGTEYYNDLKKKFGGDIVKTLWAYNCGEGNVKNNKIPQETIEHAMKILRTYHNLKRGEK